MDALPAIFNITHAKRDVILAVMIEQNIFLRDTFPPPPLTLSLNAGEAHGSRIVLVSMTNQLNCLK